MCVYVGVSIDFVCVCMYVCVCVCVGIVFCAILSPYLQRWIREFNGNLWALNIRNSKCAANITYLNSLLAGVVVAVVVEDSNCGTLWSNDIDWLEMSTKWVDETLPPLNVLTTVWHHFRLVRSNPIHRYATLTQNWWQWNNVVSVYKPFKCDNFLLRIMIFVVVVFLISLERLDRS